MEFFIRFRANAESPAYQLAPQTIENQSKLTWKNVAWDFRSKVGEPISLQFFWFKMNGIKLEFLAPWLRSEVQVNTTSTIATIPLPYAEVKVVYRTKKRYDPKYEGIVLMGQVETVEVDFPFGSGAFWNAFAALENHQIVARARIGPMGQTPLMQHYLGRAQHVQTTEFARQRNYTWLPRPEAQRDELSPREESKWETHAAEAVQLQRISGRLSSFVSPRPPPPSGLGEMDNDAWSNERRVLPIVLRAQDGGIKWQFFNLGAAAVGDAPYAESCYLRWESFVTKGKGQVETVLTPHLKLRLDFEMRDAAVEITQVRLEAREYSQTLSVMGRNQGAKTV